jgi:hypothetical protein
LCKTSPVVWEQEPSRREADARAGGQAESKEEAMSVLEDIAGALMKGKANDVKALVEKALAEGVAPGKILN